MALQYYTPCEGYGVCCLFTDSCGTCGTDRPGPLSERLSGFRRGLLFRLGFFDGGLFLLLGFFLLELEVHELENGELGAIADAPAGPHDARVAAVAAGK